MNRLILIGNGFDLAHGMKTSFHDFLADYLCNAVITFYTTKSYDDVLLSISTRPGLFINTTTLKRPNAETIYEHVERLRKHDAVSLKFYSTLLENIYSRASKLNWVDIEEQFFNVLISTKHIYAGKNYLSDQIDKVNNDLDYLKGKLMKYLAVQENDFVNNSEMDDLLFCFTEVIDESELIESDLMFGQEPPQKLYILNFNYTATFMNYYHECNGIIPTDFNYIHGSLDTGYGEPIFGFGDEFDKKYLEFEDERNNSLFKHIKSFQYLKAKNYLELMRFVQSDVFQVAIYGHSCGISDRTMLNQIFEHVNCKSIKIFYHDMVDVNNDFTEKTYEISRHFKDKTALRNKVVPFDLSRPMPQPKMK